MWKVAVILVIGLTATRAALAEELVGKVVPPFPRGMHEGEGSCIGPGTSCDRTIGVLVDAAETNIGIYAANSAGRDQAGKPRWMLTDLVPYPRFPKGYDLVIAACRYDKVVDLSIVAVVKNSKQEYLKATDWAYRADERSGKLTKLDPKHVDCDNIGLGAD